MSVTTPVDAAIERVDRERDRVADAVAAIDRFAAEVSEIDPVRPAGSTASPGTSSPTAGGSALAAAAGGRTPSGTGPGDRVRERFAETVHGTACGPGDESVVETMAAELGEEVAATLAPTTPGRFTPDVKEAVATAVERRRAERRAMAAALDREAESLTDAAGSFSVVVDWIVAADETPLSDLGFEALRERHGTLERHRARCGAVARERQEVLRSTTGRDGAAALPHRTLVEHLYGDAEATHPVLATAARLDDACADCQRAVRDHLVRRV